jgi:hypothetical protein
MEGALQRETNEIKRQEMQLKIDEAKAKLDGTQRERVAEASTALGGIDQSISLIGEILSDEDTLRASVGTSAWRGSLPGTKARAMAGKLEQLQSAIAATNLDKLKGAMSDKDIMFLKNIESNLDRYQDEGKFIAELNRVLKSLETARGRVMQRYGPAAENIVVVPAHPKFGDVTEGVIQQLMSLKKMSRKDALEFLSAGEGGATGSY